jgi:hypothetical protein
MILCFDPAKRLSAAECLAHQLFRDASPTAPTDGASAQGAPTDGASAQGDSGAPSDVKNNEGGGGVAAWEGGGGGGMQGDVDAARRIMAPTVN